MALRWTARGSTAVNVITWITNIAAILIAVIWFAKNNPFPYLAAADSLDEDLWQLSQRVNSACTTARYYSEYNPISEKGLAEFSPGEVCLHRDLVGSFATRSRQISRCSQTACYLNASRTLNLATLTYIVIDTSADGIISSS
jgi:hypothetical protein